jgi:hypothetical protein
MLKCSFMLSDSNDITTFYYRCVSFFMLADVSIYQGSDMLYINICYTCLFVTRNSD